MAILQLKSKHEDTLIARMLDTFQQIIYHLTDVAPFYSKMEPWEEKEYRGVYESNLSKLEVMKQTLLSNPEAFAGILAEYALTVDKFLSECLNLAHHQQQAEEKLSIEVFRAWAKDWSKSYLFSGALINSVHWRTFTKKLDTLLGKGWGFERALGANNIKVDLNKNIEYCPLQ